MDDPIFNNALYFFYADRDPTSDDDDFINSFGLAAGCIILWNNQANNTLQINANYGSSPLVWSPIANTINILAILASVGWNINTTRGYTDQSALGFNASRQPSLTNDTVVSVSVTLDATYPVYFKISADNVTYITIAILGIQSSTCSVNPTVPAGYYYQLSVDESGAPALAILQELSQ